MSGPRTVLVWRFVRSYQCTREEALLVTSVTEQDVKVPSGLLPT